MRTIQPKKAFLLTVAPDESNEQEAGFEEIEQQNEARNQEMLDQIDGVGPTTLKNAKNKNRSSFDIDFAF